MVLLELLEDQHHHQMTSIRKIKKIDFGVLAGPRVGLASVDDFFLKIRVNSHNTRGHGLTLRCSNINNNMMKISFVNGHITCWNSLPNCVVNANSIGTFK